MEHDIEQPRTRPAGVYIFSILFLIAAAAATMYLVKAHKRPGQMTMLESQAMDMTAMQAPAGSVPVAVETVRARSFATTVSYGGSVVPFAEQEVFPRVEGVIADMPVYPGDEVKRGQLLVRLESPDVNRRAAAADADAAAAYANAEAAGAETGKMRQMARAAEADLRAAEADAQYREAEFSRMEKLYSSGAVSRSELEQERAMFDSSRAGVERARADLKAAKNAFSAAGTQKKAMSAMAGAASKRASAESTAAGWLDVRSELDGVVTERLVSPGTLAQPGVAILRVADISKVRLQANVSISDAAMIKPGSSVTAESPRAPGVKFHAKVSSVFPASDPSLRTVVVEAIVENPGKKLLPGDYAAMEITTATRDEAITVPDRAIVRWGAGGKPAVWKAVNSGPGGKTIYTCVMHPEIHEPKPGNCPKCGMKLVPKKTGGKLSAALAPVETGLSDGDRIEIVSGVSEGDGIITDGIDSLREGDVVFSVKWNPDGPAELPPPPAMEGGHSGHDMKNMKEPGGMKMPSGKAASKSGKMPGGGKVLYTCPMHPEMISNKPGKCPKCGMDLVKMKNGEHRH